MCGLEPSFQVGEALREEPDGTRWGMPQEGLGVWRDFSRAVLEVGGLEGRGRNIEVGETNIWVFLGLMWMFEVEGENRGRLLWEQGTVRDREDIFPDWCLDCPEIALGCSLLVYGPFEGGERSSTFCLTQCLHYSARVTLGCGRLRLELDHPQTRSSSRRDPI